MATEENDDKAPAVGPQSGETETKDEVDNLADSLEKVKVSEAKEDDVDKDAEDAPEALRTAAQWIKDGKIKKIIVVTGAGISVSAGIPDFRSPGTGLYDNLQKYELPFPEAIFDVGFYSFKPQPFVTLARELWPGIKFKPTITHTFLSLLAKKGLMLRTYSQNIDGLEHLANLPSDKLVECHGHFRTASCIRCHKPASDPEKVKRTIVEDGEVPKCEYCGGFVKPDIVFFGEGLPSRFLKLLPRDTMAADCCLVMGTSLEVAPVCTIPDRVDWKAKRILLNRDEVGNFEPGNGRDVFQAGDCDVSVRTLASLLGWRDELETMHSQLVLEETKTD